MGKIVVVMCTDFERVVRERLQDPAIEVGCLIEEGELVPFGGGLWMTVMSPESGDRIADARPGATITGYLRLGDGSGFNPILDEPRKSVAAGVNAFAWRRLCEEMSVE
ncbi:MAG TPA: hypothetical protein VNK23_03050 [Candidatus Dormibacteraeota bacterium]|nr:hypothetical protein [Candidatus Dormibacteraeota bacterium]